MSLHLIAYIVLFALHELDRLALAGLAFALILCASLKRVIDLCISIVVRSLTYFYFIGLQFFVG